MSIYYRLYITYQYHRIIELYRGGKKSVYTYQSIKSNVERIKKDQNRIDH